eukprot:scaffold5221_cov88-Cylindrotheca_fusiformis.AAC.3
MAEHATTTTTTTAVDPEDDDDDDELFFVYTSETKERDIPEDITHLRVDSSVSEIPYEAFQKYESLVHVKLPAESLTRIGVAAFHSCFNLKLVEFVSNNHYAYSSLDQHPPSLRTNSRTSVFPERAGTKLEIEDFAFGFCHLRKLVICSPSMKFGEGVFQMCRGLLSVELPEGLQVITPALFANCFGLKTVNIPSTVIKIDRCAFDRCRSLPSVDLPHGLLEIGEKSFSGCVSIETIRIPTTVSSIGEEAFMECKGLRHIELSTTLERIEKGVFCGCEQLECMEIPPTVSFIGEHAFNRCDSLSHIRIPPSVKRIAPIAVIGCKSLISVELPERILIGNADQNSRDEGSFYLANLAIPTLPEDDQAVSHFLYRESGLRRVVDDEAGLLHKLRHRFDNAPLNKLCYYQSYHSPEDAMQQLHNLVEQDNPLAAAHQTDEFGMTPLHVLSLSRTPNMDMFLALMDKGKADHIIHGRDSFGKTPMDYLCLNRMPNSSGVIRSVLCTRFNYVLRLYRSDMLQAINKVLTIDFTSRRKEILATYLKLLSYERKVILSLLKLRLWENSGASFIASIVLPFLDTLDVEDYFFRSRYWRSYYRVHCAPVS